MNEKLQILKMLEEGKINSEEAAKLLQSVGADGAYEPANRDDRAYDRPARDDRAYDRSNNNRPAPSTSTRTPVGFDDFANDLGRKFETLARDMEPKIQRFVGVVAEKTADMADKISKNINESESRSRTTPSGRSATGGTSQPSASYSRPTSAVSPTTSSPRSFEMKVDSGYNELNLMAYNGDIVVSGYNGDKITVKIFAKELRQGARLELMRLGSRYYLSYDEDEFKSVSIDALVPERLFNSVVLGASNGRTDVSNISAEYFTTQSSGGAAAFKYIKSDNIRLDTSNGVLSLDNISGKNAHIEGSNGAVDANYLDVENLHLTTSNSAINMIAAEFTHASEYTWVIETSNGKISLNVPSSPRIGYHVKANTSLGSVRLGLTGLNFLSNTPNSAEAVSVSYDSAMTRVRISAETSNAGLSIN